MALFEIIWNWFLFLVAVLVTTAILSLVFGYIDGSAMRVSEKERKEWAERVYQRNAKMCAQNPRKSWCRTEL